MIISFVAAMSKNRVIGKNNKIPWSMPADVRHMRKMIEGKPLIMGRKTHESIGRPLPDRKNIILTRDKSYRQEGCQTATSIEEAIQLCRNASEAMIIGGEQVFTMFLPLAKRMYLTLIDADFEGDAFFPEYNSDDWVIVSEESQVNDEDGLKYSFVNLEKA